MPRRARIPRLGTAPQDPGTWRRIPALPVDWFHPRSSAHRPRTLVRIAASGQGLHFAWEVQDRHVLSRITAVNGPVHTDSCVEAFLQPRPGGPYLSLEINAGGTPHAVLVRDPRRTGGWFADADQVDPSLLRRCVRVRASLPAEIADEIAAPCPWTLAVDVAVELFRTVFDPSVAAAGGWRGNFHKCADATSHPHWGCWSPVGERLDFHQPDRFAPLTFIS